jgi:general L-amino acid transport system substrate-binding protein
VQVVKAVGNYGEVFERNLGTSTPIQLDRASNRQWSNGGLIYSPPFR